MIATPGSSQPQSAKLRAPTRRAGKADEHLGTVYSTADRDLAAYAGRPRIRYWRLWAAAGGPAAECRFPDDHCHRQLSRREPADDGLGDRDAARNAIHLDSRAHPDDLALRHRDDDDHAAVRSVAQHRRCGGGRADGDQCGNRSAAERFAEPTDLPESQSGRFPDHDLCRPFGRGAGIPAR